VGAPGDALRAPVRARLLGPEHPPFVAVDEPAPALGSIEAIQRFVASRAASDHCTSDDALGYNQAGLFD
jgi:hypothetical protein